MITYTCGFLRTFCVLFEHDTDVRGQLWMSWIEPIARGMQKIRARLLVTFEDQWGEEVVNGHTPAPELHAEVVVGVF
jgi:hypothetical protein